MHAIALLGYTDRMSEGGRASHVRAANTYSIIGSSRYIRHSPIFHQATGIRLPGKGSGTGTPWARRCPREEAERVQLETRRMRWILIAHSDEEILETKTYEDLYDAYQESKALIGPYHYFIMVRDDRAMLCRSRRGKRTLTFETVDHQAFGITDDDLEYAVLMQAGDFPTDGEFEISDHVEGKLRALMAV
jgi:hypothetical protein